MDIVSSAYEVCESDCDCLGIKFVGYQGGAKYKYFVTNEYSNVYFQ